MKSIENEIASTSKDMIHIAIGQWDFSSYYAKHCAALIVSILENTGNPVTIHIFHNETIGLKNPTAYHDNTDKYRIIEKTYDTKIVYHHINLPEWVLSTDRPRLKRITPGGLFRFYFHQTLNNLDKIIYLDGDMIVTTDLGTVWSIPMDNYSIAACLENNPPQFDNPRYRDTYKQLEFNREKYFNSGFLVMNLKRIRNLNCLPDLGINFVYEHSGIDVECMDQDAFNWLFHDDVYVLDPKYNFFARSLAQYSQEYIDRIVSRNYTDCCIHYFSANKPWIVYFGNIDIPYWYYLSKTPYGSSHEQWVNNMSIAFPSNISDAVHSVYPTFLCSMGVKSAIVNLFIIVCKVIHHYASLIIKFVLKT